MGELQIIFGALTVLAIIAQGTLYLKKDENITIYIINTGLALILAYISFTSFPSNLVTQKMIASILGAISLLALIPYYMKKSLLVSKLLLSISVLGGLLYLFFGV